MWELKTSSLASIRAETKACEERPDGASQYEGQGHYQVKKLKVENILFPAPQFDRSIDLAPPLFITFLQIHLLFM